MQSRDVDEKTHNLRSCKIKSIFEESIPIRNEMH